MVHYDSTAYQIGAFFGSLVITFLLTRLANKLLSKKLSGGKRAVTSFFIALVIILGVTSFTMSLADAIIGYVPALILWLLVDLWRSKKTAPAATRQSQVANDQTQRTLQHHR